MRKIDNTPCDYFIICSGSSNTQVTAIVNSIQKNVSKKIREKPYHIEGLENAQWVLIDYINLVVHVFQDEIREYYDIEELWGDAKTTKVVSNY
jgi:ribosome-associated protein